MKVKQDLLVKLLYTTIIENYPSLNSWFYIVCNEVTLEMNGRQEIMEELYNLFGVVGKNVDQLKSNTKKGE